MNNILRVDLYDTNTECDILINDVLIDEGFAVKCEEPYQSKVTLRYLTLWRRLGMDCGGELIGFCRMKFSLKNSTTRERVYYNLLTMCEFAAN